VGVCGGGVSVFSVFSGGRGKMAYMPVRQCPQGSRKPCANCICCVYQLFQGLLPSCIQAAHRWTGSGWGVSGLPLMIATNDQGNSRVRGGVLMLLTC
jgi:hypothetical protein